VIFRNDVERTDEQMGVFGEVTWDLNETWAVTAGARWYDIEVDFKGSANSAFCNSFGPDADKFGTDISDLYDGDGSFTYRGGHSGGVCVPNLTFTRDDSLADIEAAGLSAGAAAGVYNAVRAPDKAETDGVIGKVSLAWTPDDDSLYYFTWSEGFRPGLLNRPGGASGPNGYTVPFALDTDEVVNLEAGWKLDLADGRVRLNGSVFFVEVEDLQTTIFDTSIVNLFFSDNAADAEIMGLEADFIWAATDNLTLTGAVSFLDTEITSVKTPTSDVVKGDELAFAPEFQGNLRARYEWQSGSAIMHIMPHIAWSADSQSDVITINNSEVDGWLLAGVSLGMSKDNWSGEFYIDNIFDEEVELARSFVFDRARVSYGRPLTMGLRVSFDL
jgi:outer membrane receptor protein involved in Fe transport